MTDRVMLIFGCGFSGTALARVLLKQGWRVIGTTRSVNNLPQLAQAGIEGVVWPGRDMSPLLAEATHILQSIGPKDGGDPVLEALGDDIEAAKPQWFGYLSTTGVYGDRDGGWVDETSLLTPATKRGQMRVAAEEGWKARDLPLHIFRLAGIYGPGRGPFAKLRAGTARRLIKKNQVFSRVHVEDIAQTLAASIEQPNPGAVYNVCDDDPAPPQDVMAYAAGLLDLPVPPAIAIEDAPMTPMARSFYAESKKVSNQRIKDELGVSLKFKDYRQGLKAELLAQRSTQ